jgi:AbrB family looped-hinge helix DNA binding protein
MLVKVDSGGRIMIPKPLRDALGIKPGSVLDVSPYGAALQLVPGGRAGQRVEMDGALVVTGETTIGDDDVFALIDAGRR